MRSNLLSVQYLLAIIMSLLLTIAQNKQYCVWADSVFSGKINSERKIWVNPKLKYYATSLKVSVYIVNQPFGNWHCLGSMDKDNKKVIPACCYWIIKPVGSFDLGGDWHRLIDEMNNNNINGLITPPGIKDDHLKTLKKINNLELLYIQDFSNLSETGLSHLASLTGLKELYLPLHDKIARKDDIKNYLINISTYGKNSLTKCLFNNIENTAVKYISNIKTLELLDLSISRINDEGLKQISKLKKLKVLRIYNSKHVTDKGIEYLTGLKNIISITLSAGDLFSRSDLTDRTLKQLSKLPRLKELNLFWSSCFSSDSFKYICNIKTLRKLLIHKFINLKDEDFEKIENLCNLEALELYDTKYLSGNSITSLVGLNKLRQLTWKFYFLNEAEVKHTLDFKALSQCEQLQKLDLDHIYCKDSVDKKVKSLKTLKKLKELESLSLTEFKLLKKDFKYISDKPKLHKLKLEKIVWIGDKKHFFDLRNLKTLRMLCVSGFSYSLFPETFTNLINLEELKIDSYQKLSTIANDISKLPKLKKLVIKPIGNYYKDNNPLITRFEKLKSLEELHLANFGELTEKGLKKLSDIPKLKKLYFQLDTTFPHNKLHYLKRLTVFGIDEIKVNQLKHISSPNLSRIDIGTCLKEEREYSKRDWEFFKELPLLEEFYVRNISRNLLSDAKRILSKQLPACKLRYMDFNGYH